MIISLEGIDCSGKTTVFENLAGTERLEKNNNNRISYTREPTDMWTGRQVRKHIANESAHPLRVLMLFLADHNLHYNTSIKSALNRNEILLTDRYMDSRYAYQAAELEQYIQSEPIPYLRQLHETEWNVKTNEYKMVAKNIAPTQIYERLSEIGKYFLGAAFADELPVENPHKLQNPEDDFTGISSSNDSCTWSQLPSKTIYLNLPVETSLSRLPEDNERFEKERTLRKVKMYYDELISSDSERFTIVNATQSPETVANEVTEIIESHLY